MKHFTNPEEKRKYLTGEKIPTLVLNMAVPSIISMLITSFYNMADTFFVGQIGTTATAAVGVIFPLMSIIQALGFTFGHGSGNYISRKLGQGEVEDAKKMAATGFVSALVAGAIFGLVGLIFLDGLVGILGATPTIAPYARQYAIYILIGTPFMASSLVLNNQLRFQGSAFFGMIGMGVGAVLNIALDPLFIFVLDMGVSGAALATILSQIVSFCLLLGGTRRGGNIRMNLANFRFSGFYFSWIFKGGLPSLARQGLASVATICLNNAAMGYGDAAIAAMSVVQRITMFGASAMIGFGQGFQPVCGFNYGAGLYSRVRKGFWFCVKVSTVALLAIAALGYGFAPKLVALFRDDPQVVAYGALALRYQCITFCLQGWVVMGNMMQQSMGKTVPATFMAVARQGLFFIPMVWILSAALGFTGVQLSQSAADLITFAVSIPVQARILRELPQDKIQKTN